MNDDIHRRIAGAMAKSAASAPAAPINVYERTPKLKARHRFKGRKTFAGDLVGNSLVVRQGAFLVETDSEGALIGARHDKRAILSANIGDRLVVSAKDVALWAAVCVVEVAQILSESWTSIRTVVHVLRGESILGAVWVQPAGKARP